MCGIAGFYGTPKWDEPRRNVLGRMIESIRYRGPDESGMHLEDRIGLGHVRLSIVDLSGGQQPMSDSANQYWVTFNGEIFNYVELKAELESAGHRFRTSSDTEVILEAYRSKSVNCVDDFNGDFAFALWDKSLDRLFLARDRMGVRPLYYAFHDGVLLFASEVKALFQVPGFPAALDPRGLCQVFQFWYPIAPQTVFQNVFELPPGQLLVADSGGVSVRPYWQPHFPDVRETVSSPSEDELSDEFRAILNDAVRIRLRADVPVGAYLSGGFDSSAISVLAHRQCHDRLRTFSVGFEDAEFDETPFQKEMAEFIGCDHTALNITNSEIARQFPEVIRHTERPILRTAPTPLFKLAELVRRSGFKVVLTGEGADEVFGGYDLFKEAKVRRFWARQPNSTVRPSLLKRLYPYLPGLQQQSTASLLAFFQIGLDRPDDPFFSHRPRWESCSGILQFFSDDLHSQLVGYHPIEELQSTLPPEFEHWHPLSRAQYLEMAHLLPGYILSSQGDRVSMAHAVEGRFPFLDRRVVDFGAKLPPRMKLRGLSEKDFLRDCFRNDLPRAIVCRPKQPYRSPDHRAFFGTGAPEYVEEQLSNRAISQTGYFDPKSVEKLVRKCKAGTPGTRDSMALVGILSVQLLHEQLIENRAASRPSHANPMRIVASEDTLDGS